MAGDPAETAVTVTVLVPTGVSAFGLELLPLQPSDRLVTSESATAQNTHAHDRRRSEHNFGPLDHNRMPANELSPSRNANDVPVP